MQKLCYCGHDCAKCVTFLATARNDDRLRRLSQQFYKREFQLDLPLDELHCFGGRSKACFRLSADCPWKKCCKEHGYDTCSECGDYPCGPLSAYRDKYVNKCNQL